MTCGPFLLWDQMIQGLGKRYVNNCEYFRALQNSNTKVCPPVQGTNTQVSVSGLPPVLAGPRSAVGRAPDL